MNIKFLKNKYFRIALFIVAVCAAIGALSALVVGAANAMFFDNPHFALRRVEVVSAYGQGWWDGRSPEIVKELQLSLGKNNLFELDLANLRTTLLKRQPVLDNITVSRVLPDTLKFVVSEKIPIAHLISEKSPFVVDATGTIISSRTCVKLGKDLPVILNLPQQVKLSIGRTCEYLKPALDLIQLLKEDRFREMRAVKISMNNTKELNVAMLYKRKVYGVIMPREHLSFMLDKLLRAFKQNSGQDGDKRKINLTYEGQVVFDDLKSSTERGQ